MPEKQKPKPKIPNLGQLVTSLKKRIEQLERDVYAVRDVINTKDNWNAEIKDWIGHEVKITLRSGNICSGELLWTDRYNVCVNEGGKSRTIVTKGGIDTITRYF